MRGDRKAVATALCLATALASAIGTSSAGAAEYVDEVYPQVSVREGLVYGSAPDAQANLVELVLDLYEPVGDVSERRPAVIWVHGGGFGAGSRHNPKIVDLAETFARRGYVTAAISYRLLADPPCSQQEQGSPECVAAALAAKDDAQAAVRWLRANYGELRIDPSRIAIGGFSAGSVASLLTGTWPDNPGGSGNAGERSDVQAVVSNCGFLPTANMITPGDAPATFFHGTRDNLIPIEAAQATHAALLAAGVPSEFHAFQGAGHCPNWETFREPTVSGSVAFLFTHLRLPLKRRCDVLARGGEFDDRLEGTEFGDLLKGGEGDDRLRGLEGGDCLRGGPGDDRLDGGDDPDELIAKGGDDRIDAKDGDRDEVRCGGGRDDFARVDARDKVRGCERTPGLD